MSATEPVIEDCIHSPETMIYECAECHAAYLRTHPYGEGDE